MLHAASRTFPSGSDASITSNPMFASLNAAVARRQWGHAFVVTTATTCIPSSLTMSSSLEAQRGAARFLWRPPRPWGTRVFNWEPRNEIDLVSKVGRHALCAKEFTPRFDTLARATKHTGVTAVAAIKHGGRGVVRRVVCHWRTGTSPRVIFFTSSHLSRNKPPGRKTRDLCASPQALRGHSCVHRVPHFYAPRPHALWFRKCPERVRRWSPPRLTVTENFTW